MSKSLKLPVFAALFCFGVAHATPSIDEPAANTHDEDTVEPPLPVHDFKDGTVVSNPYL